MAEKIIYNNTNISTATTSMAATYDMFVGAQQADNIVLTFEDSDSRWKKWAPKSGDTIEYQRDGVSTGIMHIYEPQLLNGLCIIRACSMPQDAKVKHSKSWQQVHLLQFGNEVAARFGMTFELLGLSDLYYEHMRQENETDIGFLQKIASLEGAALILFNNRIIMAQEKPLEASDAILQVSAAGSYIESSDKRGLAYGSAEVRAGVYYGKYTADASNKRNFLPEQSIMAGSNAEAARFAAGQLRQINKQLTDAKMQTSLMPELTAGVNIELTGSDVPFWNGKNYLYHVRHEYHKQQTTLFMRKPLEKS